MRGQRFEKALVLPPGEFQVQRRGREIPGDGPDLRILRGRFFDAVGHCFAAPARFHAHALVKLRGAFDALRFHQVHQAETAVAHLRGDRGDALRDHVFRDIRAEETQDPPDLGRRVFEIRVVVRDQALRLRNALHHEAVVRFPKAQAELVGKIVPAVQRERNFQRVPQADDHFQIRQELQPERKREAVAGILPSPERTRMKASREGAGLGRERGDVGRVPVRGVIRRVIPRPAQRGEQRVVEFHEFQMLPKALLIVRACRHHLLIAAEEDAALLQDADDHRSARAMHACDADRRGGLRRAGARRGPGRSVR